MPIEFTLLARMPVPIAECPNCHGRPFVPFLRGTVQRSQRPFWRAVRNALTGRQLPPTRPFCALICESCKEIVGHEDPYETGSVTAGGLLVPDHELLERYR